MTAWEHQEYVVLPSALRSATVTSSDFENRTGRGIVLYLDITDSTGTPTLDVKLQSVDAVTGDAYDVVGAAFAQQDGTVRRLTLIVYPGIGETANRAVNDVLPRRWRIVATFGSTTDITYSIGAEVLQ